MPDGEIMQSGAVGQLEFGVDRGEVVAQGALTDAEASGHMPDRCRWITNQFTDHDALFTRQPSQLPLMGRHSTVRSRRRRQHAYHRRTPEPKFTRMKFDDGLEQHVHRIVFVHHPARPRQHGRIQL